MIYQIISLILIAIFYISYILKNILLKRKNINSFQLGKQKDKKTKEKNFEIVLKIFTVSMFLIQIASIIISDNWFMINVPPYIKIIGLIFLLIADVIFILSIITMKDNWRVGITNDETELVTTGIYKLSRNPAFLSFDILYIGLCLVFPNPVNLVMMIILLFMFDHQINNEEKYLKITFGKQYEEYCEKVKRYFVIF